MNGLCYMYGVCGGIMKTGNYRNMWCRDLWINKISLIESIAVGSSSIINANYDDDVHVIYVSFTTTNSVIQLSVDLSLYRHPVIH